MRTFGFRQAAEFWEVAGDPELAFRLHALVGGAPDYKDLCGGAGPRSLADLDHWVQLRLLNPASVMFRSGGLLLGEEAPTADLASCVSVLGAIVTGAARRSEIAAALGRPEGTVDPLLAALTGMGVIERPQDPLDAERSGFVIVKPIACRAHLREHQLEAVFVEEPVATGRVLAIGETNAAGGPMEAGQLKRLEHLLALLPGERVGQPPRLLLFSRSGFAAGLEAEAAARPDAELVDLERLYRGV